MIKKKTNYRSNFNEKKKNLAKNHHIPPNTLDTT